MADIKMYVGIPKDFKGYFQNTFYASYPTSDLIEVPAIKIPEQRNNIIFSSKGKVANKEDFTRDGTYMDPMYALFALYSTVDQESYFSLYFTYTFKHPRSLRYLLLRTAKRVRGTRKDKDDEDKATPKELPADMFCSFSYKIQTKDKYMAEQLRLNIKSAFSPFISNGKLKISQSQKFIGLSHGQAENFFHIPTMANFIKGLDYCVYRKLPYPSNLPTIKNTKEDDLTIL